MQKRIIILCIFILTLAGNIFLSQKLLATNTSGPRKNVMSCETPPQTGLSDGKVACYGILDYGAEFGGDVDLCSDEDGLPKNGCEIKTNACSTGVATAQMYYSNPGKSENSGSLDNIANALKSTPEIVQSNIANIWLYTCGKATTSSKDSGTYKLYYNENPIANTTLENISKSYATQRCRETSEKYPTYGVKCTWNNEQIYYIAEPQTVATLYVYVNGVSNLTKEKLNKETALSECTSRALQYLNSEVKCTWNAEQIYYMKKVEEVGTLEVLVNGKNVLTTTNLTKTNALSQCKIKASSYPYTEIKCTWNTSQIHYVAATEKIATFILIVDGETYGAKHEITLLKAKESCGNSQETYKNSQVECKWDNAVFFSSESEPDESEEYCGYSYEYFSDVARCVKSSYLSYYILMKTEFGSTISRLSATKLKLVLQKIEDIEYKYSAESSLRLKLEALKLVIEKEIREQEGDNFDFEDLFQ